MLTDHMQVQLIADPMAGLPLRRTVKPGDFAGPVADIPVFGEALQHAAHLAGDTARWNATPFGARRAVGREGVAFHTVSWQARRAVRLKDSRMTEVRAGNAAPLPSRIVYLVVVKLNPG